MAQLILVASNGQSFQFDVFAGTGFDQHNGAVSGGWGEQPRALQKTLLTPTAQGLETWSFKAKWADGVSAAGELQALKALGLPVTVTTGTGENKGQWVIERVSTDYGYVLFDGVGQVVDVSVSLKEFVDASAG